jgi:hypothetical protein
MPCDNCHKPSRIVTQVGVFLASDQPNLPRGFAYEQKWYCPKCLVREANLGE